MTTDRALEAAAEALNAYIREGREAGHVNISSHGAAWAAIDAYLDALLTELPEEAVEAAVKVLVYSEVVRDVDRLEAREAISAFLLSLRSSSRGANR